jgi:hypothetical protein
MGAFDPNSFAVASFSANSFYFFGGSLPVTSMTFTGFHVNMGTMMNRM